MIDAVEVAEIIVLAAGSSVQLHGGNSTVTRVTWNDRELAVKNYSARSDASIRLRHEHEALTYLWNHGLRIAPEPLGFDAKATIGIQQWISGNNPSLTKSSLRFLLSVMGQLRDLAAEPGERYPLAATDSIETLDHMKQQVRTRISHLKGARSIDVLNVLNQLQSDVASIQQTSLDSQLWPQTLSPSDFGPHNLIQRTDGKGFVLIDLEFFGWDDPHKFIADTLVHPMTTWSKSSLTEFMDKAFLIYDLSEERLHGLIPWICFKWVTIVLARAEREFLHGNMDASARSLVRAEAYRSRALNFSKSSLDSFGVKAMVIQELTA